MVTVRELDEYIRQKRYRLINSVLFIKDGEVLLERYYNGFGEDSRHNICSVWKSILSAVTGVCLEKGWIENLDEPIYKYLPEFDRDIHPYHRKITIRHLLTMSSGIYFNGGVHYHCPMIEQMKRSKTWISHIADVAVSELPGTRFVYKEWDVILLSALIGRAAGVASYDICREYVYEPLGMQSAVWPQSPCGVCYNAHEDKNGGNADLSAGDLAKFGLMILNNGGYKGKRILPEAYVRQAVAPSVGNSNYGFLWWLSGENHSCRGFGGQEVNVYPGLNAVAVLQATVTPSSKSYIDVCNMIKGAFV